MPTSKQEFDAASWRPTIAGRRCAVASGHYLATLAAQRVLDHGGNAIDAGVTAAMALAILQPDLVSFAGVAPTLIYLKAEDRVISLAGLGYWPRATDIDRLRREGGKSVPEGILRTVLPAAPATHIEALRRYGTISFERAVTPAFELARDGFALYPVLHYGIESNKERFARYPENRAIFLRDASAPAPMSVFKQENLARTLYRLIEAERKCCGDRDAKLRAVHDCFYRGAIAHDIAQYYAREGGFLSFDDLAQFEVPIETSISCVYKEYAVHACDTWCQGIALLQALKILEHSDLGRSSLNSAEYIHTVASVFDLVFADREAYVGDPKFVDVPVRELLSDSYAAGQRQRIDTSRAFREMPRPGMPRGSTAPVRTPSSASGKVPAPADTIYACAADSLGNVYSATLSDTSYDGPMVPGMGLLISSRGSQSRLEANHPAVVAPGKRPRLTPSPALAFKNGEFFMAFGTPGGDIQSQAMLQVFLNVTQFGLQVQQAIEAPRFGTFNYPNSFAPHDYFPARLCLENRIGAAETAALAALGYDIERWGAAVWLAGAVCAIKRESTTGLLHAGADPRREAYALAW
jgi:gamma-glutamyltranspeptidase/glutathione hydrolase